MKLQLTKQIIITKKDERYLALDNLCWLSKNIYNVTLYLVRQEFFKTGKYLNYFKANKILHDRKDYDYYKIPYAQSAQQVMKQVDHDFSSFFKALKSPKNKGKKVHLCKSRC